MAGAITFVKVTRNTSVPAKVFLNRQKLKTSHSVSINSKSIIQLCHVNVIKLSNNDLNVLMADIKSELVKILVEEPLLELFQKYKLNQLGDKFVFLHRGDWICKILVSIKLLVNVRFKLNLINIEELNYLHDYKKINFSRTIITSNNAQLNLLIRELKLVQPNFGDSEDDELLDQKKSFDYKLTKSNLFSNKINDCIDIYVHKRGT